MLTSRSSQNPAPLPQEQPDENEKRRIHRISLSLAVRVEVRIDAKVSWNEVTRLGDVSAFGAGFTLKRPVKRGRLVLMTMPMPRQLRSFDFAEEQYRVWAAVRRCIPIENTTDSFSVGVAFVGKHPPDSFIQNPSQLYDISHREGERDGLWQLIPADLMSKESHLPKDDRKHTRFSIPETLILQKVDEAGNTIDAEFTVTENISLGGAAVLTSLKMEPGAFLRVTSERLDVTILSVVRGSRVGDDGITRLHLEFIDRHFPLEGIDYSAYPTS